MPKAGLQNKVKEHNAKSKHKVTLPMLEAVYRRGVGAYKTNPGSVRPSVKSPEQWAMARVNSFLRIVSGSKSANHDKYDVLSCIRTVCQQIKHDVDILWVEVHVEHPTCLAEH